MSRKIDPGSLIAVVRLRGSVKMNREVGETFRMMRLLAANRCAVMHATRGNLGMVDKVSDYVAWGEISKPVLDVLVERRGRLAGDKRLDPKQAKDIVQKIEKAGIKGSGLKGAFRLSPPKGGLRSIREHYPKGDLGYRGSKIDELLVRMV